MRTIFLSPHKAHQPHALLRHLGFLAVPKELGALLPGLCPGDTSAWKALSAHLVGLTPVLPQVITQRAPSQLPSHLNS